MCFGFFFLLFVSHCIFAQYCDNLCHLWILSRVKCHLLLVVEKLKIARSSLDVILLGSCWSTAVRFFTDSWCQGRERVGLIVFFLHFEILWSGFHPCSIYAVDRVLKF